MNAEQRQLLTSLPKVDLLLKRPALQQWEKEFSRYLIKQSVQDVLEQVRRDIVSGQCHIPPDTAYLEAAVIDHFKSSRRFHLRQVINATGTILHTNLGRAVLSAPIGSHIADIAGHYSNLEYDLAQGMRGSRYNHLQSLVGQLTGAEDVLIVNNNAAAVLLTLTTLCKGREVVISRGELVEIGGHFRIPDVIELSGSVIREVGTTNKTHLEDYRRAVCEQTGAIMKVHTSNYRMIGFIESVRADDIASLAHGYGLPLINDLGSGLLVDMCRFGLPYEPTVREALQQGGDIVLFSGDKLLGGPQAGIIAGKKQYIEQMKKNPLLRALRVDKMIMAALEATLKLYLDENMAVKNIPVLQMLAQTSCECMAKAKALQQLLQEGCPDLQAAVETCQDMVGGGSYPEYTLPGYALVLSRENITADALERKLRRAEVPVISRIQKDKVCLSVRTVAEQEIPLLSRMIVQALL